VIFFSAHGVPQTYIKDAGDPYKDEMEACVKLMMNELRNQGIYNRHALAYQV
jgi:ferrochelatase